MYSSDELFSERSQLYGQAAQGNVGKACYGGIALNLRAQLLEVIEHLLEEAVVVRHVGRQDDSVVAEANRFRHSNAGAHAGSLCTQRAVKHCRFADQQ